MEPWYILVVVGIVVGILDQLEKEVRRGRVELIRQAVECLSQNNATRGVSRTGHLQFKSFVETGHKNTV